MCYGRKCEREEGGERDEKRMLEGKGEILREKRRECEKERVERMREMRREENV